MSRFPSRPGTLRRRERARRPRIESLETRDLLAVFTVTSVADSGSGSLRDAITQANANTESGTDLILFNLNGDERTISLQSALPTITRPVAINGASQPGYAGNPTVVLNGTGAGAGANGLTFASSGNVVRGLVINGFQGTSDGTGGQAITLLGGNNRVDNCYIGLAANGSTAIPNRVGIQVESSNNIIGGDAVATPEARNFISGNRGAGSTAGAGIILGSQAAGNAIQGNYIGLNFNGQTAVANTYGIIFAPRTGAATNGAANLIGGNSANLGQGNFVSGNTLDGLSLNGASSTIVIGNYLGINALGDAAGNGGYAITQFVNSGSTAAVNLPNTIGVDAANAGNLILNNARGGIAVLNASGGTVLGTNIQGNSFDGNGGPSIDIGANGVTPGYLFVTSSTRNPNGLLTLSGVYHGAPNASYLVSFYADDASDPSGFGEGNQFLGSVRVTTDVLGNATFSQPFNGVDRTVFAATATDAAGTTSELSLEFPLGTNVPTANLATSLSGPSGTVFAGANVALVATITNNGTGAAQGVLFDDLLPAGLFFLSATASNGATVTADGSGLVNANLGTIAPGASVTITINTNATSTGTVTNAAAAFSSTFDTDYTNNQATQQVTVVPPVQATSDLGIGQTSFAPFGGKVVGQNLVYTISVTNYGPSPATGVTVTDFVPGGQQFVDASSSQGSSSFNNGLLTTNLGSLPVGATATVTILLRLTSAGNAVNTANVAGNQLDTNTGNNSSTLVDTITGAVATQPLTLTQVSSVASGTVGQPQTITLTVTNPNSVAAPGVVLTHTPPANATAITAVVSQGSVSIFQGSLVANLGTIAPGASAVMAVTLTPTSNSPLVSNAAAVASGVPGALPTFSTVTIPVGAVGVGPSVLGITAPGSGSNLNRLAISFSGNLNVQSARRTTNYRVFALGATGAGSTQIPVRSVAYDAVTRVATITLSRAVPINQLFRLVVVGATATGIRDTAGNRLVGSAGAGSNYTATFPGGSLVRA